MADVEWNYETLDDALRAHAGRLESEPLPPPSLRLSGWEDRKRHIFRSVFQTDDAFQPTLNATLITGSMEPGQPFGVLRWRSSGNQDHGNNNNNNSSSSSEDLILPDAGGAADDQASFDRAWHAVTTRIVLPLGVAVDDSFGTLPPESQLGSQDAAAEEDFREALRLVLHADTLLPRATHKQDIVSWHTQQVRRHYAHHVLPMLSACAEGVLADGQGGRNSPGSASYCEEHMTIVQHSVRTLEAAFRLYFYGLMLIVRGLPPVDDSKSSGSDSQRRRPPQTAQTIPAADTVSSRFRQDVHALVANSAPQGLMVSIRIVMAWMTSVLLGMSASPEPADRSGSRPGRAPVISLPKPPSKNDADAQILRQQMHEMLASLCSVGLAGRSFQVLFAEIMDTNMTCFIGRSFAGRWTDAAPTEADVVPRSNARLSRASGSSASTNISTLYDWVENHYSRLARDVLSRISRDKRDSVSFSDVTKWKEVALGRLSALRMTELFDIVLHWPLSRGGLVDLRVSVTTPQRRAQLIAAFTESLRKRLLIPACSTLEILQTYIAMIRTFHALDPSNVLLSSVVGQLQMYLCQRDDAVRIVVDGLLAEPDEDAAVAAAASTTATGTVAERIAASIAGPMPSPTSTPAASGKLTELAAILNDPSQQRRRHIDEEEPDWNDMEWVPDPIDAGTNYRRPKSEDVIGTLINALGSREAFTKEFQNIIAERLLSSQRVFAKEVKVLNLLKKRFGESSMQNCEVMIRDIQDSKRLDAIIHQLLREDDQDTVSSPWTRQQQQLQQQAGGPDLQYQAKILSRLYWPGLDREQFLLPTPVADTQKRYEAGYESQKSSRKLTWLNQLGQASVELELADRTVCVDCKTYEAAVIYAFQQDPSNDESEQSPTAAAPVRRSISELVEMLQADDDLVEMALAFWQQRGVLRPEASGASSGRADTYVVVERLDQEEGGEEGGGDKGSSATAGFAAAGGTDVDSSNVNSNSRQARADDAQRTVYWQFIVGMLTNSAASMPLAQIAMMMKMLMAEGFPWSNEELLEFLGEKVVDGELEVTGGKYRLVKK